MNDAAGCPLRFRLPDETVARLALPYTPYRWPDSGNFESGDGFSVKEPWEGHREKKWYAEKRKPFDRLQALLAPHQAQWIEADCVAALIPLEREGFAVQINGVELIKQSICARRPTPPHGLAEAAYSGDTCGARIVGGGRLLNGEKRGYGIALDLKPLRQ